ncbi:MAG TPA: FAD-dependent oxidoreductase [Solirubrobacterales bacterium]|nr:FAD-dependent oxidoreductase [Solirubrobacterales bacterium]
MAAEAEQTPPIDVCVVGGGAAGLYTALVAAERGASVKVISRKPLSESSSFWAQGGLAAAIGEDDSPALHAEDTITAGRGSCRRSAADTLATEAPGVVAELERRGVDFDRDAEGRLELALEGGHSRRRIVHAGGAGTGRRITERLAALAAEEPGVEVAEGASALALWSDGRRCHGVITDRGAVHATATVMATGGAAALWARTTNPWGAIGAGPVIAHQAGAELADLELCQFHPTALAAPGNDADGLLVTEAVRGEGATLLDAEGRRFTDELAPRDAVTLAVLDRMDRERSDHVRLDMRGLSEQRFPNVFEALREAGFDPEEEPVPVAPASHYVMGGIATDLAGRTSLPGLLAVGECACTGLHGANRLASNSLTECFVLGARAAAAATEEPFDEPPPPEPGWRFEPPPASTREAVWRLAGPRRRREELEELLDDPYPLARMIAAFALAREESRGSHRRVDFPRQDPGLDGRHLVCADDAEPQWQQWE